MKKNIFKIPNLQPMLEAVTDFVQKHQGKKGFILTDDPKKDKMYSIEYSIEENIANEFNIKAIRVSKGILEILTDVVNVRFDNSAVKASPDTDWEPVQYSDVVYFTPTIFNIAETIDEYV